MFEPELTEFLESGCALIVGVIAADGQPYATRGWGLTVLSPDDGTVRLLLDAEDVAAIVALSTTPTIAVTAANVATLRSTQLKGRTVRIEAGAGHDLDRAARYCEAFFTDVAESEATPRTLVARLAPADYVAAIVEVHDWFDQTPGPAAGAPMVAPPT